MALKLVSSNEESKYVVVGEILIVFLAGEEVSVSYSDYVRSNPALAIGYLEKLRDEIAALVKISKLA